MESNFKEDLLKLIPLLCSSDSPTQKNAEKTFWALRENQQFYQAILQVVSQPYPLATHLYLCIMLREYIKEYFHQHEQDEPTYYVMELYFVDPFEPSASILQECCVLCAKKSFPNEMFVSKVLAQMDSPQPKYRARAYSLMLEFLEALNQQCRKANAFRLLCENLTIIIRDKYITLNPQIYNQQQLLYLGIMILKALSEKNPKSILQWDTVRDMITKVNLIADIQKRQKTEVVWWKYLIQNMCRKPMQFEHYSVFFNYFLETYGKYPGEEMLELQLSLLNQLLIKLSINLKTCVDIEMGMTASSIFSRSRLRQIIDWIMGAVDGCTRRNDNVRSLSANIIRIFWTQLDRELVSQILTDKLEYLGRINDFNDPVFCKQKASIYFLLSSLFVQLKNDLNYDSIIMGILTNEFMNCSNQKLLGSCLDLLYVYLEQNLEIAQDCTTAILSTVPRLLNVNNFAIKENVCECLLALCKHKMLENTVIEDIVKGILDHVLQVEDYAEATQLVELFGQTSLYCRKKIDLALRNAVGNFIWKFCMSQLKDKSRCQLHCSLLDLLTQCISSHPQNIPLEHLLLITAVISQGIHPNKDIMMRQASFKLLTICLTKQVDIKLDFRYVISNLQELVLKQEDYADDAAKIFVYISFRERAEVLSAVVRLLSKVKSGIYRGYYSFLWVIELLSIFLKTKFPDSIISALVKYKPVACDFSKILILVRILIRKQDLDLFMALSDQILQGIEYMRLRMIDVLLLQNYCRIKIEAMGLMAKNTALNNDNNILSLEALVNQLGSMKINQDEEKQDGEKLQIKKGYLEKVGNTLQNMRPVQTHWILIETQLIDCDPGIFKLLESDLKSVTNQKI